MVNGLSFFIGECRKWKSAFALIVLIQFFTLSACDSLDSTETLNVQDFQWPTLVDRTHADSILWYPQDLPYDGGFRIGYLGEMRPEIVLEGWFFDLEPFEDEGERGEFQHWGASRLVLFVDTSQALLEQFLEFRLPGQPFKPKALHVLPIFVWNPTSETIGIGVGRYLRGDLMRLNPEGQWQKISKPYSFGCGTGIFDILLPPQHIAVALLPSYRGRLKSRLRFQLNDQYSNEFFGGFDSLPTSLDDR